MDKPYVVCHILSSLDGKIDGTFMSAPETHLVREEYGRIRKEYGCQAVLYGTVTMKEVYADGPAPEFENNEHMGPFVDFVAGTNVRNYIVSIDPQGILGWKSPYVEKKGRPRAHIIEVLTEQVSDQYANYLKKLGVSYIYAGQEQLDCALALRKLKYMFGIDRLMIAGGAMINWSFAVEGLIDELSLVISPVADGATGTVSVFRKADFLPAESTATFCLKGIEEVCGDGVWLRYKIKKKS